MIFINLNYNVNTSFVLQTSGSHDLGRFGRHWWSALGIGRNVSCCLASVLLLYLERSQMDRQSTALSFFQLSVTQKKELVFV